MWCVLFCVQKMPEEQAFAVLIKIMYQYRHRDVFKTNFYQLHLMFYQLDRLLKVCMYSGTSDNGHSEEWQEANSLSIVWRLSTLCGVSIIGGSTVNTHVHLVWLSQSPE